MARDVRPMSIKTLINRNAAHYGFDATLNPYRGCSHSCKYCYARDSHTYLDLGIGTDFETIIFSKIFSQDQLRQELHRLPLSKVVAIGTATDPYQPIESKTRNTRMILEAIKESGHGVSITTKSPLILRDLDLLQMLAERNQVFVHISLITMDRELCRHLEPGTASPSRRWKTVDHLINAGVPVALFCAPVIPEWTDDWDNLDALFHAARTHNVSWVMTGLSHFTPNMLTYFSEHLATLDPRRAEAFRSHFDDRAQLRVGYRQTFNTRLTTLYARHQLRDRGTGPMAFRAYEQSMWNF